MSHEASDSAKQRSIPDLDAITRAYKSPVQSIFDSLESMNQLIEKVNPTLDTEALQRAWDSARDLSNISTLQSLSYPALSDLAVGSNLRVAEAIGRQEREIEEEIAAVDEAGGALAGQPEVTLSPDAVVGLTQSLAVQVEIGRRSNAQLDDLIKALRDGQAEQRKANTQLFWATVAIVLLTVVLVVLELLPRVIEMLRGA